MENMKDLASISLDNLCNGALREKVALAMMQIARNIIDPNTKADKARRLTITMTFKPDKNRKLNPVSIATNVSLAPPDADETVMLIGQDIRTGRIEISEYGSNQPAMQVSGEALPVCTQEIRPNRIFDQETGEIIEPQQQYSKPIDLRQAN